ncbi:hypothetical protein AVEN_178869-1 [Araneus ventricosus]|uniref:Uncharacterized protein n=1 Tax=Araneus ventricosus TaxID=182803 RepID=A0A4Y2RLX6_ARAVE|nr:hypothetical protein AVEN_178869-1 [Araneus ventricosus]
MRILELQKMEYGIFLWHRIIHQAMDMIKGLSRLALKRIISGDWNERLTIVLLTQNMTPSEASGFSPDELLMKRSLRTVLDLLHPDFVEKKK